MKLYVCKLQIQIYFITDFLQLHLIYVRNINLKITKKQQKYDHENRLHKPVTMPHLVTKQCPKTFFFTLLLTFGSRNPLLLISWSVPSTLQKAYWTVTSHCTKTDQCCDAISTDQLPTELYQGIQTVAGRGQPVRCGTAGLVGPEAVVLTTVTRQDDDEAAGGDDVDVS